MRPVVRGRRRSGTFAALAVLASVALSACGSTVPTAQSGSGGGDPSLSLDPQAPGRAPAVEGGSAPNPLGELGPGVDGAGRPAAPGRSGAPAAPGSVVRPDGRLVPAVFRIGLQYTSNGAAAVSAVSGGSYDGDARAETDAVIAWLNKHGGIAGRRVVPSYNNIDATAPPSAQSESACAQWTQDDHVTAAIPTSAVMDLDLMRECLGRARVPAFMGYIASRTLRSSFVRSPLWFENGSLSLNDYARAYVRGLAEQGFFKGGKVGVVYYAKPPFTTALQSDLLPALRAAGVSSSATFGASIDGASTLGSGSREMSSAVLSFRSQGVDKVLFFEPWIGYFAFLNSAKAQGYYPTYGLSSQQGPQLTVDLGFAPADQLRNARIVSWNPMTDTRDYARYGGSRFGLCNRIFKDAGLARGSDQTTYWGQLRSCENLLVVRDAYASAPARLTPEVFTRGMEALGSRVGLATRPGGSFAATKHWATARYWHGRFDVARETFVLAGPPRSTGG